jgi:hypothetical protein
VANQGGKDEQRYCCKSCKGQAKRDRRADRLKDAQTHGRQTDAPQATLDSKDAI